jgi:hypothetical protein
MARLRGLISGSVRGSARPQGHPPVRRSSLDLEVLEDRLAPAGLSPQASFSLQQGSLYEVVGSSKTLIDTNVQSSATGSIAGTNHLFDLNSGGSVKEFNGSSWTTITGPDTSVSQIAVGNGGLYMQGHNGGSNAGVWKYSGSGTGWTALTGSTWQDAPETWPVASTHPAAAPEMPKGPPGPPPSPPPPPPPLGVTLASEHPAAATAYSNVNGTLFGPNGPSYLDVKQGQAGDCWLLAGLAEVAARDPADITSMFTYDGTTVENGATVGVYTVRFYLSSGGRTAVVVDTELPSGGGYYDQPVGEPGAVNGSSSPVLWVALAEKAYAYANLYGWVTTGDEGSNSYAALNGGDPAWALQAITGKPTSGGLPNPGDIANAWNQGQLIVLGTWNPLSPYIVSDHAYAVVGVNQGWYEIFNPWGTNATYDGWAPEQKFGLWWVSGIFIAQNFIWDTYGSGAAPGGKGAPVPGSVTGAPQGNQPHPDWAALGTAGSAAEKAAAELASSLLALQKRTGALDAIFTGSASW